MVGRLVEVFAPHLARVRPRAPVQSTERGEPASLFRRKCILYMLHNLNSMQFFYRHKHVQNLYLKITNQASTGLLKHSQKSFIDLPLSLPSLPLLLFLIVIQGDIGKFGQKYEKGYKKMKEKSKLKE